MSREIMQQALDYIKETYNFCMVMQQSKEREEQLIKALEAELAKPEQEAYGYAKRLAEFIWEKHYKKESPDWTPLPDVLGVLTQIDNMTCGLELAKPEQEADLFWDADDPENGYDSIYELISNYGVGDELKILRAKVLAPIKIRITQAGDEEFEYAEVTK